MEGALVGVVFPAAHKLCAKMLLKKMCACCWKKTGAWKKSRCNAEESSCHAFLQRFSSGTHLLKTF
jgi:hypothetical protein